MNIKYQHSFIAFILIFLMTGCAQNVRWTAVTPSDALLKEVAKEMFGVKYETPTPYETWTEKDKKAVPTKVLFDKTMREIPTEKTKGISFTTRLPNTNFYTAGYSTRLYWLGLDTPEKYAFYNLVDKPMLGFKYTYEGIITGSAFQAHHMVRSSNERADLLLATKPVTPYHIIIYYEDGTSAEFDFNSISRTVRFGGGFKTKQLSKFDGILWMEIDFHTKTYVVTGPYSK